MLQFKPKFVFFTPKFEVKNKIPSRLRVLHASKCLCKIYMKKILIENKMQILTQICIAWQKLLQSVTSTFWDRFEVSKP